MIKTEEIKALRERISCYSPYNEQEAADKELMLASLDTFLGKSFSRECLSQHFTTSAFIFNADHTKVLMCEHIIDRSLAWIGGHADGIADLYSVVKREIGEETGLENFTPVTEEIAALTCIAIPGHRKNGKYVPSHIHMDVAYVFEANEEEPIRPMEGENTGVKWVTIEEMRQQVKDVWKNEYAYEKLLERFA